MTKRKPKIKLPKSVWVVFDLETGHILNTYTAKELKEFSEEINDTYEVIAHYELKG